MTNSLAPRSIARRLSFALVAVGTIAAAAPAIQAASADSCSEGHCNPRTFLLSRTPSGLLPNGASTNATVSHDERIASVMGYQSNASNLVSGDTNGKSDVFIVRRATPYYGINGTDWRPGRTQMISRGLNGRPANGHSSKPAVGGAVDVTPRCIAFLSEASNLVPGDTNRRRDAFVADLASGRIQRVSVSSSGRQSNGTTSDVSVNGTCNRVAFTSDASNLALTGGGKSNWSSLRTSAPPRGTQQVYVRQFAGGGDNGRYDDLKGVTFVASADNGRPGNGSSFDPVLPSREGDSVAFTSRATNLVANDRYPREDVLWRTMAARSRNGRYGIQGDTQLVSRSRSGKAGNGASRNPAISGATQFTQKGQYIAYETDATDIASGLTDNNKTTDIVRTKLFRGSNSSVYSSNGQYSRSTGNAPAKDPSISEAAEFIFHHSETTNYNKHPSAYKNDQNGRISDIFLWTQKRMGAIAIVWDNNFKALGMPSMRSEGSARGNYHAFETRDPYADLVLAEREGWNQIPRAEMRSRAAADPKFSQVYLRYGGPE